MRDDKGGGRETEVKGRAGWRSSRNSTQTTPSYLFQS